MGTAIGGFTRITVLDLKTSLRRRLLRVLVCVVGSPWRPRRQSDAVLSASIIHRSGQLKRASIRYLRRLRQVEVPGSIFNHLGLRIRAPQTHSLGDGDTMDRNWKRSMRGRGGR